MTQDKNQVSSSSGNASQGQGGQTQGSQTGTAQSGSQQNQSGGAQSTGTKKQLSDYTQDEIQRYRQENPNWQPCDEGKVHGPGDYLFAEAVLSGRF